MEGKREEGLGKNPKGSKGAKRVIEKKRKHSKVLTVW